MPGEAPKIVPNLQCIAFKPSELVKFKQYLKPNGILAGHDYGFEPTSKAIIKFANNNNLAVWTKNDNVWYYKPYMETPQ